MRTVAMLSLLLILALLAGCAATGSGQSSENPAATTAPVDTTSAPTTAATVAATSAPTTAATVAATSAPTATATTAATEEATEAPTAGADATPGPSRIPHPIEGDPYEDCTSCHGPEGIRPFPADHTNFTLEQCQTCHKPAE